MEFSLSLNRALQVKILLLFDIQKVKPNELISWAVYALLKHLILKGEKRGNEWLAQNATELTILIFRVNG